MARSDLPAVDVRPVNVVGASDPAVPVGPPVPGHLLKFQARLLNVPVPLAQPACLFMIDSGAG
eukprot:2410613-Prorocentrum_lima.AAC.1